MDMPVARGVLIGLCGVFVGVGASFLLFTCVGGECSVGVTVWFRTRAMAPAPACGLAAHIDVGPGFDSTSPAQSRFCLPATGRETWPARQKRATSEKLYRSDLKSGIVRIKLASFIKTVKY